MRSKRARRGMTLFELSFPVCNSRISNRVFAIDKDARRCRRQSSSGALLGVLAEAPSAHRLVISHSSAVASRTFPCAGPMAYIQWPMAGPKAVTLPRPQRTFSSSSIMPSSLVTIYFTGQKMSVCPSPPPGPLFRTHGPIRQTFVLPHIATQLA
jgi:hypothetical protein